MNELWDQLAEQLADRIASQVDRQVKAAFERYLRSSIKVVYDETEAADFLRVSKDTLAAWRRRRLIDFAQYPIGRVKNGKTEDDLGDLFTYDIAALLNFRERYLIHVNGANVYQIGRQITPLGPGVEGKRLRRAA